MGNFNQGRGGGGFRDNRGGGFGGGRDGGRGGFSRGGFGGGRSDRGEVTMHQATCAECKSLCEVPFMPTNTKPVYCKSCFESRGGNKTSDRGGFGGPRRDDRRDDRRGGDRPSFAPKAPQDGGKMDIVIAKLDKLIRLMEKTSGAEATVEAPKAEDVKEDKKVVAVASKVKKVSKKKVSSKK